MFKNRLFRVGYKRSFIDKNLLTYEECVNLKLTRDDRQFKNGGNLNSVMLVISFDKFCRVDKRVRRILDSAKNNLNGLPDYCNAHSALPKLRNFLSTRVILHTKMSDIDYSNV